MSGDSIADFLTFVSPICILVLFFMCFFRFLFRSCECGIQNEDLESCQRDSRPTSSSISRVHPCYYHSELEGQLSPYGDLVFCPVHCEETFPPKYEDALKMAVCSARSENDRRWSVVADEHNPSSRPSISSPPPVYSDEPDVNSVPIHDSNQNSQISRNQETELPPSYANQQSPTNSNLFHPILRVTSAFRRTESQNNSRTRNSEIETTISSTTAPIPTISATVPQTSPDRHSRRSSIRPPRVPLPGAIQESDDESDSDLDQVRISPISTQTQL